LSYLTTSVGSDWLISPFFLENVRPGNFIIRDIFEFTICQQQKVGAPVAMCKVLEHHTVSFTFSNLLNQKINIYKEIKYRTLSTV
jgi:hypothetical protein